MSTGSVAMLRCIRVPNALFATGIVDCLNKVGPYASLTVVPTHLLNISNFSDIHDPHLFPKAFANGTISGPYAAQTASDLVRWPLLLKYGGVYADVGVVQIGDLDLLWNQTIADPDSPYHVVTYNCGNVGERLFANYFPAGT